MRVSEAGREVIMRKAQEVRDLVGRRAGKNKEEVRKERSQTKKMA